MRCTGGPRGAHRIDNEQAMPAQMEKQMKKLVLVGAISAVLAACATAPQRSEQVEQARAHIQTLSQDPLAQQAAGKDLEAARKSLQDAELALQQKQPPAVVDHYAYLALRHAEAGEARVSESHSRQEVARAENDRNKILMDSRNREATSAQAQAENARNQASAAQAQLANAQQQLADLQAKQTDRGVVVTLGDVLFDTGQATLKPGASLAMNRLSTYLSSNPQTKVLIEGHTDSRGSDEYNEALSERRARAVATELESRGISGGQVQTLGRGKAYPVASNDTPEGRQQNRRVEIVFSDASGRFAQGSQATQR
jgi:outer membrane protein OmpA-like peptidoglycan-associated protein